MCLCVKNVRTWHKSNTLFSEINAKEINAIAELCLKFQNEISAVATNRFRNV